jgi:hypothetical protein
MNCFETAARLHLYIDRELSVHEVEIVQQHLTDCQYCECRFHFDMRIKRLIHEHCTIERRPKPTCVKLLRFTYAVGGCYSIDVEMGFEQTLKIAKALAIF